MAYPLTLPFEDDFPDSDIRGHADYPGEDIYYVSSINSSNSESVTVPSSPGSKAMIRTGYNDAGSGQTTYFRLLRSFDIQADTTIQVRGMSADAIGGLDASAIQFRMCVLSQRNYSQRTSNDGFGIQIADGVVSYGGQINQASSSNKYNGGGTEDIGFFPTGIDVQVSSDGTAIQYTFYETEDDEDPEIISYSWALDAENDWGAVGSEYTGDAYLAFDVRLGATNTVDEYSEVWMDSVSITPEPATAGLLVAGLTGFVLRRSRRRR
ncbi:MAG: PEP-CTERM sorting domain-containing protein [Phycisphaerae bacterium]|nr:PEP-CTERM sorting domain-containing protein [Phycisphaerae bacterium]